MRFKVLPYQSKVPEGATGTVFLLPDMWNDYFKFVTMFRVVYCDLSGNKHEIGDVKIGEFEMAADQQSPRLPDEFEFLGGPFFSLGQDDTYYENLNELGAEVRNEYLQAMSDIARDDALFERALQEPVTNVSLLRYVSRGTVVRQFRRMTRGGARLTAFSFSFCTPYDGLDIAERAEFKFTVVPDSSPPTNVHVLIGRNGVGKTYTMNNMVLSILEDRTGTDKAGGFIWHKSLDDNYDTYFDLKIGRFPSVVWVSFSAFDSFELPKTGAYPDLEIMYQYVGLKKYFEGQGGVSMPKSSIELEEEFGESVKLLISSSSKMQRWVKALQLLRSDPIFSTDAVDFFIESINGPFKDSSSNYSESALQVFSALSSGHKIVLLTITRLVELIEERSLVLIDEPEAHLHPPLLAAFIRSLSDLLIDRNGVAIISTHSPVILQEVPKSCVWCVRRSGFAVAIDRPTLETFGESVGMLTHAVFGLEVTDSGFHKLIRDQVDRGLSYEGVLTHFSDQLGAEGSAIARSLIATRDRIGAQSDEKD